MRGRVLLVGCPVCGSQEAWSAEWAEVFLELWHENRSIRCVREGCPGFLVPRHVACACHVHPGGHARQARRPHPTNDDVEAP
ncbi:MAG TPA: hypothetical protein VM241_07205 [Candidatus Thermoplasmatota archaeon]|nr:hypothetical protein [Candidatus Thermoplasmatota archaeon]